MSILAVVRPASALASHAAWQRYPSYALFSADGFDPLLEEVAKRDGVPLIGARELFAGMGLAQHTSG